MSTATYPRMKASGMEWIQAIPSEWDVLPLYAVATECGEPNKGMLESNLLSLSYGRIVNKDINSNDGLLPESFETYQVVQTDDLVLRLTDLQNDKRSLRSAIVRERGIITSAYLAVRPQNIFPEYFAYLLRAYDLTKVFYSMGGGLRQSMKFSDIKRMPILLPSMEEQIRIANFLDQEIAKIDSLIFEQERLVELLKIRIESLVLESFEAHDTVKLRLANAAQVIQRPVTQVAGEVYEPLGLYNRGRGLFHKELRSIEEMGDSDFFWIKNGDLIFSGQFAWEGAVALAYPEEENCVVSHRYPVVRGEEGITLTEYLFALFTTSHGNFLLNESSVGAAGRNRPLNINSLLKEKIPVPNMLAQEKIAKMVHQRRNLLVEVANQRNLLNEHRATLISAAATGQIDVRAHAGKKEYA